jgi:glycosyltransferase involved in cell wall biosynthesis
MKIAIVHEWLVANAGSEKVLSELVALFPQADIFTLVDFLSREERHAILGSKIPRTSFIQHLPLARKHFRHYLPLFPRAVASYELSDYDLIVSSSSAFAKGIRRHPEQSHVCYCHTPMRYAWDLFDEYTLSLPQPKRFLARAVLRRLRRWDLETAGNVDTFIANSTFVQERIRRLYGRDAHLIHPPVATELFTLRREKEEFYLTAGRLVPYKKTRLIVEAFNRMPERRLVVLGTGEELGLLHKIAGSNITLMGYQPDEVLIDMLQRARAFLFAAEEDFGILPVEAMACGTPVIAYGKGGARDTVIEGLSGIFFGEQNPESIESAVKRFEQMRFSPLEISRYAQKFSRHRFRAEMKKLFDL